MPLSPVAPFNPAPAYSGTFIPQIWSSKLQKKFYDASTFADISNTDYEGEVANQGDTVNIRTVPTLAINSYTPGTSLTYQVPSASNITLNIDQAKYFAFQVNDVLAHQADIPLMETFSNDAGEQLRIAIDRECFLSTFNQGSSQNMGATAGRISGAFNLGTDTAPVVLSPSNIIQTITALSTVLDEQNIPSTDRFLVISPIDRQILMNSNLNNAQFMGDSQSMLRNGRIGMIDRFAVYVSNLLPSAAANFNWTGGAQGGTAKRRAIIAGHKSAITFASQINKVETVRNPNDFGDYVRGMQVYGRQVIVPTALALAVVQ